MTDQTTIHLQRLLDRLRAGDVGARDQLIDRACERLRLLTHWMLRSYPGVRRWEQTDDVLQNVLVRLHRALADMKPESVRHFLNLAALLTRRELRDLARHHFGPEGPGAHHHSDAAGRAADDSGGALQQSPQASTASPSSLAEWTEFHERVEKLPDEEREVVNLLWYEGMTQEAVASLLGVDERTIRRRWRSARLSLQRTMTEG